MASPSFLGIQAPDSYTVKKLRSALALKRWTTIYAVEIASCSNCAEGEGEEEALHRRPVPPLAIAIHALMGPTQVSFDGLACTSLSAMAREQDRNELYDYYFTYLDRPVFNGISYDNEFPHISFHEEYCVPEEDGKGNRNLSRDKWSQIVRRVGSNLVFKHPKPRYLERLLHPASPRGTLFYNPLIGYTVQEGALVLLYPVARWNPDSQKKDRRRLIPVQSFPRAVRNHCPVESNHVFYIVAMIIGAIMDPLWKQDDLLYNKEITESLRFDSATGLPQIFGHLRSYVSREPYARSLRSVPPIDSNGASIEDYADRKEERLDGWPMLAHWTTVERLFLLLKDRDHGAIRLVLELSDDPGAAAFLKKCDVVADELHAEQKKLFAEVIPAMIERGGPDLEEQRARRDSIQVAKEAELAPHKAHFITKDFGMKLPPSWIVEVIADFEERAERQIEQELLHHPEIAKHVGSHSAERFGMFVSGVLFPSSSPSRRCR